MKKVITMVLCNRPEYTRTVLEALKRCHGIEEYLILPHIEPGNEEVIAMARAIDFAEVQVVVNPERFGGGRNTYHAWEAGFNLADFIVHIEDDTVPAPDCLRFMEHGCEAYRNDSRVFCLASYNRYPCPAEQHYAISTRSAYTCWLVGIWKDRGLWAQKDWSPDPRRYATHLAKRAVKESLREVYPLLSRSQNIGVDNGIHEHSAQWHRVYHHTDYWAGDHALPPGPYHEVYNPMVTAVMVTGLHPDRYPAARLAIECFKRQTYTHRELLILNYGGQALDQHDDARIREIMIGEKPGDTIGGLPSLALQHAHSDLIILWADDGQHSPDMMAAQVVAASFQPASEGCILHPVSPEPAAKI